MCPFGTAVIDPFQKYELHYKLELSDDDALYLFLRRHQPGHRRPTRRGRPARRSGTHSLRLRGVKNDGKRRRILRFSNLSVNMGPAGTDAGADIQRTDADAHPHGYLYARAATDACRRPGRPAGVAAHAHPRTASRRRRRSIAAEGSPVEGDASWLTWNLTRQRAKRSRRRGRKSSRELGEALSLNTPGTFPQRHTHQRLAAPWRRLMPARSCSTGCGRSSLEHFDSRF